jgi:spore coat polysaccharide biosynthesis predicted glycosyltransferase SpsG
LKHILVCLGGGAYDVALLKTAHALALCPELKPTIVLGFAQSNLEKRLKKILPKAEIIAKGVNIPSFLVNFDLAIVSAGYLKIECAIAGIPAIMISTQWHQIPLAEEFSRLSHMPHIGYMGFFKPKELADLIHSFQEIKKRKQNAAHAQTLIDGKGMDRVYQTVFEKERNL